MSRKVYLASTSPRRRELLGSCGVTFSVIDPHVDDGQLPTPSRQRVPLRDWVASLAYLKARAGLRVLRREGVDLADAIVIGADTLVECGGEVLSKPEEASDAERMIRMVLNRDHRVLTGVAIIDCADPILPTRRIFTDSATVRVGALSDDQILAHLASGSWRGKAGGYNLAEQLEWNWPMEVVGDPGTVMGLPVSRLRGILGRMSKRVGGGGG
jgi:septum formation protein